MLQIISATILQRQPKTMCPNTGILLSTNCLIWICIKGYSSLHISLSQDLLAQKMSFKDMCYKSHDCINIFKNTWKTREFRGKINKAPQIHCQSGHNLSNLTANTVT